MDSVNMTSETTAVTGIGGFIGTTTSGTNNQEGMTTITAKVDPVQSKVQMFLSHYTDVITF